MSDIPLVDRGRRPGAVWSTSIALMLFGLIGVVAGLLVLADSDATRALTRGADAITPTVAIALLGVSLVQVLAGLLVLFGVEVGRKLAFGIGVAAILGGLVTIMTSGRPTAISEIVANVVLIIALRRDPVVSWCR